MSEQNIPIVNLNEIRNALKAERVPVDMLSFSDYSRELYIRVPSRAADSHWLCDWVETHYPEARLKGVCNDIYRFLHVTYVFPAIPAEATL